MLVLTLYPVFSAQGIDGYNRYSQPYTGGYRTYDGRDRDVYHHRVSTLQDGVYAGSYYREPYIGMGSQVADYSYDSNLPLNDQLADPSATPQYPYTSADIIE
ncbi:hypothetical protein Noda2021_10290 [Candidatus Dependentiae bacterium Noda2021]|nr:hypothetical protein Noda2021_10290 [Candidatus Dependentiae bacterium Noda2021]